MQSENVDREFVESLQVARGIVTWNLGGSAKALESHTDSGTYAGTIIGETKYHMIQRVSAQLAVVHPKHLLNQTPTVGQAVRIHYSNERGVVSDWRDRKNEKQNRSDRVFGEPAHPAFFGLRLGSGERAPGRNLRLQGPGR